jgi:hypothetical protein
LEAPNQVKNHPVFKELVRYRTLLERIRPLDRKMKYQIDKMLKIANAGEEGIDESLNYAPNPDQLILGDGEEDENDEENGGKKNEKDGIYRAPRFSSVPYEDEEREEEKQAKKEELNRKRLQKSTILSELREEFSERPIEILTNTSSALDKELAKEEKEKKEYEESRFVRLVTSKKDKIRKRQRERDAMSGDAVGSIDNFANVQNILSLDKTAHKLLPKAETKHQKIGGKIGGIFSHVEAPVNTNNNKIRKTSNANHPNNRSTGGGNNLTGRSSGTSALSTTTTKTTDGGSGATEGSSKSRGATGKKKKVVFSNLF